MLPALLSSHVLTLIFQTRMPTTGVLLKAVAEQKIMSSVVFWDPRHLVLTDSHLILSKTNEPDVITDSIILHEVLNVFSDAGSDEGKAHVQLTSLVALRKLALDLNCLSANLPAQQKTGQEMVIRTDPLGASYGRTYILRIMQQSEFEEWYETLRRVVHDATRR